MKTAKQLRILFLLAFSLSLLTACAGNGGTKTGGDTSGVNTSADIKSNASYDYEQITAQEAKAIMDAGEDFILIDARTEAEFAEGHIEGAVLIPEYEVSERAEKELPDKDALILVYCRSGRRSKIASGKLAELGYTNVKEFGGIIDWPYEIVK